MSDLAYLALAFALVAATAGFGLLCAHLMAKKDKS